tara:strand:+ start:3638 stop:3799 length:162 start_codon:yes stop_codon:yes gene_type:complete
MSLYRVSSTWSNNLESRKQFILERLKARIRVEAEREEKERLLMLSEKQNVNGQ